MNREMNKKTGTAATVTQDSVRQFIDENMDKICSTMNKNMDLLIKKTSDGFKIATVKY